MPTTPGQAVPFAGGQEDRPRSTATCIAQGQVHSVTGGGLIVGGGLTANSLITGNYSTAFQAGSNASGAVALNAANLPNNGYLFSMKQLADASWRLLATSAGQLIWGDGAGNPTANLYWKSASTLGTDSNFYAGGEMRANNGGVSTQIYLGGDGKIYFGTAGDTIISPRWCWCFENGRAAIRWASIRRWQHGLFPGSSVNAPGFIYNPSAATSNALVSQLQGEANARLTIDVSGYHSWGPGGATALDTNLYRVSAGALRTDAIFVVGTSLYVGTSVVIDNGNSGSKLYFGNALDTNLYRESAGVLRTDGGLKVGQYLYAAIEVIGRYGSATQTKIGYVGGNAGIAFGNAEDTNLYRYAANQLKTDGAFLTGAYLVANNGANQVISGEISPFVGGAARAGLLFGAANDTSLYRNGAGNLKTDGTFTAAKDVYVDGGGTGAKLYFGSSADASLYRSAVEL